MREWKDGMTNPGQLTQIIRCSVALGGVIRPDPLPCTAACDMGRLTEGAGGFVSILERGGGEEEEEKMKKEEMMEMDVMIGGEVRSKILICQWEWTYCSV